MIGCGKKEEPVPFPFLIGKVLTVKAGSIDFQWTPVFPFLIGKVLTF